MGALTKSGMTAFPEGLTSVLFNKQGVLRFRMEWKPGNGNPVFLLASLALPKIMLHSFHIIPTPVSAAWENKFFKSYSNLDTSFT